LRSSIDHDTDNSPRGDFGLIGLAVMGQNLILNAADHGFNVIAFNRTVSKVDHFLANEAKGKLDISCLLGLVWWRKAYFMLHRKIHRGCPLNRGVRKQAQETPPYDDVGHGWKAS
jgi:hypothetical protein